MLQIRRQQLDTLTTAMRHKANLQLVEYARKRFPTVFEKIDEPAAYKLVDHVRTTAERYGIEREDNVATFLDFTVMYGEEFHKARWATDVLSSEAIHAPDKMALLEERARQTGVTL